LSCPNGTPSTRLMISLSADGEKFDPRKVVSKSQHLARALRKDNEEVSELWRLSSPRASSMQTALVLRYSAAWVAFSCYLQGTVRFLALLETSLPLETLRSVLFRSPNRVRALLAF
jgi:hypothetical protein